MLLLIFSDLNQKKLEIIEIFLIIYSALNEKNWKRRNFFW